MSLTRKMLLIAMAIMAAYSQSFARDHINDTLWTRSFDIHGHATARFSPDGSIVAIGCGNGEIRIYNAMTGDSITTFQQEVDGILALDFSKNGKYLAAGGNAGYISIFDLKEKKLHKKMLHENIVLYADIRSLCFSDDGKKLYALAYTGDHEIYIYDSGTFEELKKFKLPGARSALTMSPDSRKLALATDEIYGDVHLEQRDAETLEEIPNGRFDIDDNVFLPDIDYSPDGNKIAAINDYGKIFIADNQAKTLSTIKSSATKGFCIKYTHNGNYLLSGLIIDNVYNPTADYFVIDKNNKIIDTIDSKFNQLNDEFTWGSPYGADFSPTDEYFISAASKGIAMVRFNPQTGINENFNLIEETVSPNPSNGTVMVHHNFSNSAITSIIIVNTSGMTVKTINAADIPQDDNKIEINVSGLAPGAYFIRIATELESATFKLIVND